jgi:hypothetical protein
MFLLAYSGTPPPSLIEEPIPLGLMPPFEEPIPFTELTSPLSMCQGYCTETGHGMSCAPSTMTLEGINPFPWHKSYSLQDYNNVLWFDIPADWYSDAETTLPPLNTRLYPKHPYNYSGSDPPLTHEKMVYEALRDGVMDFIDFNVENLSNPVLKFIHRIVKALIRMIIEFLRFISLTIHISSTSIGFDTALYWVWIEHHLVVSRDRVLSGYFDRAYVVLSPLVYSAVFAFLQSMYHRTLGSLISTVVDKPQELEMSMSPDGVSTASGVVTYTPWWAHYPFPSVSLQKWTVWRWRPIEFLSISKEVSFTVNAEQIAIAVVQNLATQQPTQSGPAMPEQDLEMSVPHSKILPCKRPPKSMGIVHCSPPGSQDLSNFPFALFGRVSIEGKNYGITANHVVRDLSLYAQTGCKIYIRTHNNGIAHDTPFPFPTYPVYKDSPVENLDVSIIEVPPGIWSQLGMKCAKSTPRVRTGDMTKVYTPFSNGSIGMSYGVVESAHSLFQFKHSASTECGASGGMIFTRSNLVLGIHVKRHPRSQRNVGTALRPFYEPLTTETPVPQDDLWQEEEPDWGDNHHLGSSYYEADDHYVEDEEEHFLDDDEDEYQRYAIVRTKAGHRAMHATDRRTYTEAEKTANFWRARNMDYAVDELENSYPDECKYPFTDDITLDPNSPGFREKKKVTTAETTESHDSKTSAADLSWGDIKIESLPSTSGSKTDDAQKELDVCHDSKIKASFKAAASTESHDPKTSAKIETKIPIAPPIPDPPTEETFSEKDFRIGASTPSSTVSLKWVAKTFSKGACWTPLVPPAPTPSNTNLEATSGNKASQQIVTTSSAPPHAASPQVGGPRRRKRRPRKKKKSTVSTSGTPPTLPSAPPGDPSPTKPPSGSLEISQNSKTSKKPQTASLKNTPKLLSPQDFETLKALMKTYSAAASSGTSSGLSPKTPNPVSLTQ